MKLPRQLSKMTNGKSADCALKPTPRRSFPRRAARPAKPSESAWVARCGTGALSTRWPTTSASAFGADFPNGSAAASSAGSSRLQVLLVVDRRVDDRRFDSQIRGHLSHQDFMQQLGEFDGVLRPSLDRLAEQHNSRTGRVTSNIDPRRNQPGQRNRTIG